MRDDIQDHCRSGNIYIPVLLRERKIRSKEPLVWHILGIPAKQLRPLQRDFRGEPAPEALRSHRGGQEQPPIYHH